MCAQLKPDLKGRDSGCAWQLQLTHDHGQQPNLAGLLAQMLIKQHEYQQDEYQQHELTENQLVLKCDVCDCMIQVP